MQNNLIDVLRLQREHSGILEHIMVTLDTLDKAYIDSSGQLREITERLANLQNNLNEHVHFEEQEVLPTLARHATEIMSRGLVLEHEEILRVQVS